MAELKSLDMSVLKSASAEERAAFGQKLLANFETSGFCKIVKHPIAGEDVSEIFKQSRNFFSLPVEHKANLINDPNTAIQRGWSEIGAEKTWALHGQRLGLHGSHKSSDAKEHFDYGSPSNIQFPNKWPTEADVPSFRSRLEKFYEDCSSVSNTLLEVLATTLGMPATSFTSRCALNQSSTMRINHFPPVDASLFESGDVCRIWPHFDFGTITLVFRDPGVSGLEIENRAKPGTFVPVPCGAQDELLVNIGETFQRWSNGVFPAGLHRVNKPYQESEIVDGLVPERYSIAFFCKADRDASVGPFPEFLKIKPREYENMTALQYQETRNKATYEKIEE